MTMTSAAGILAELARLGVSPTGLSADSRELAAGDLFIAMPGVNGDGRRYIEEAVAKGAAAVLWERDGSDAVGAIAVPNLGVEGLTRFSGEIADMVYGRPSNKLWLIGVSGTNGKTSVSQWIAQALAAQGMPCALVGTLGNGFPGALRPGPNTTPDAVTLQRALAGFVAAGAEACAMEVSSIGLAEGRVATIAFDVAVFTNLTRDHLDYHANMENYGAAKAKLFDMPGIAAAVINLDDAHGRALGSRLAGRGVRRYGYTLDGAAALDAQLRDLADELLVAEDLLVTGRGIQFTVRTAQGTAEVAASLLGRFNAANLLAVLGTLLSSGISLAPAAAALAQLSPPPGRLQAATEAQGEPLVVVDYAHTPDALEQALLTLREVAQARGGRLACLFGCGGGRDPGKRPLMGIVAARLADQVLLTSDNPRGESALGIIEDIQRGLPTTLPVEADRAVAIRRTVLAASANDVVLIAGKGHETYQETAGVRRPFSDLEQARAALGARRAAA